VPSLAADSCNSVLQLQRIPAIFLRSVICTKILVGKNDVLAVKIDFKPRGLELFVSLDLRDFTSQVRTEDRTTTYQQRVNSTLRLCSS
jgi:hypothetical protein